MTRDDARKLVQAKLDETAGKTLQQIYDEMLQVGYKCRRAACEACLVADYLSRPVLPDFHVVVTTSKAVVVPSDTNSTFHSRPEDALRLPFVLRQVVNVFDYGHLPEFDQEPVESTLNEQPFAARLHWHGRLEADKVYPYDIPVPSLLTV